MGFTDKILNLVKMGEDDYDDDDLDIEDDYEEEPKRRFGRKEAEDFDAQPVRQARPKTVKPKVVPMKSKNGLEVCVIKPATIDDGREITNTLVSGRAVILNLEGIHVELAQRIIDFTSGSCFAIDGNMQKVSNYIFIATPPTVDISGDIQDILGGAGSSDI